MQSLQKPVPAQTASPVATSQTLSVKRAEVEFHRFASMGEPEAAEQMYLDENLRREAFLRAHLDFCPTLSPFLELGANVGHTSYLLRNSFGAEGYALDLSADSLRFGRTFGKAWGMAAEPVRITGDAEHLPFADESLAFVCAFQMLSQFQDLDLLFAEVHRVLRPGGVFLFAEEPVKRRCSLRLYRAPYLAAMKPWERWLHRQGLLGYLVQDVIGASQEESVGIRQNHRLYLKDWSELMQRHFAAHRLQLFVPNRGWAEDWPQRLLPQEWSGELLGGTIGALCRKAGGPLAPVPEAVNLTNDLRCPDCHGQFYLAKQTLVCQACGFSSWAEDGVYCLLSSRAQELLYPGDRDDVADFSQESHVERLDEGWHEVEGQYGNKYRWMGAQAELTLRRVEAGSQRVRVRGFVHPEALRQEGAVRLQVLVNGTLAGESRFTRAGLFVVEHLVPGSTEYKIRLVANPVWTIPEDGRPFSVNISMVRLVPANSAEEG